MKPPKYTIADFPKKHKLEQISDRGDWIVTDNPSTVITSNPTMINYKILAT
jgi:hypothetical protein